MSGTAKKRAAGGEAGKPRAESISRTGAGRSSGAKPGPEDRGPPRESEVLSRYVARARELGARGAKIIPAASVKTAEWVLMKCRFGCGGYGERLTCPPRSPTPKQTAEALACYEWCLLVHGDEWTDIQRIVAALERDVFLDGHHKAFGMGSGPCELRASCPPSGCRRPESARPSMEACGIDVFSTARANGFPIQVLRERGCAGNYYGLVLIE